MRDMLTILTRPSARRNILRRKKIGGHYGVTRSLLAGLDALHVPYRYNPAFTSRVTSDVWVLAGVDTLQFAIELKRLGKIRFLGAGPNISILPSWDGHVLAASEVDICVVPSQWVANAYTCDSPNLTGRIRTWYAGIDPMHWLPAESIAREYCLVYNKTENTPFAAVLNLLERLNIPSRVVNYGAYSQEEYKDLLQGAACMVVLSHSESQGLALAEAWAMNVPTFCWNPGFSYCGAHRFERVHAAPYLTGATGLLWVELADLESSLRALFYTYNNFQPRQWVLENMTDVKSAQTLLNIYSKWIGLE